MSALSLKDAQRHLNLTTATSDSELQSMVDAAEAAIAERVGPLEPVNTTARVRGGSKLLRLPIAPAVSLTSVTGVSGTVVTVADLYLETMRAVVTHDSAWTFTELAYDVTYVAGRATCPDDLLLAVKELVRHMWETQRGGSARPGSRSSETMSNTLPGSAYTFPIRVTELMAPHVPILAAF